MTIIIYYRPRGAVTWTHRFSLAAASWRAFYRQARRDRQSGVYAYARNGTYTEVLA